MNHISDIAQRKIIEGITGQYIHGDQCTLGVVEIEEGSNLPLHNHVHEQITFILEGELEMTIGGQTMTLKQGDYFVIILMFPTLLLRESIASLIDVFSPVREEYK
jgi:quercetin dioxygenase-like cupin family protein